MSEHTKAETHVPSLEEPAAASAILAQDDESGAVASTDKGPWEGRLAPFRLERYFAQYEFNARFLLCCSDPEPLTMADVLSRASSLRQQQWQELSLGYTESRGWPPLLAAISSGYASGCVPAAGPTAPLVAAPQECIFLAMTALLEDSAKQGAVVVMAPGYQSLHEIAVAKGVPVLYWLPRLNDQGVPCSFDLEDLHEMLREHDKQCPQPHPQAGVRGLVVNFPHNPTGYLPSATDFRALVDLARSRDAWLFSDEMYRDLEQSPGDRLPAAVEMGYSHAVSLGGVSKSLGAPGLRIGWLASPNQTLLDRCASLKDFTTICSAAPAECLATMILEDRANVLSTVRERLAKNLALLRAFFQRHADLFDWQEPKAGTVCFPRLLKMPPAAAAAAASAAASPTTPANDRVDVAAYCTWLVETHSIMLLPATVYDGAGHLSCFRLGFGRANFPDVLQRWEQTL